MPSTPIQIRQLTLADVESLREVRLEGLRLNPEAFGSTFEAEESAPLSKYSAWISNSTGLGAFQNSQLIGIAAFGVFEGLKSSHKGWLRAMYVRPNFRGMGAGRMLVEAIIRVARQRVEIIQLSVVSENLPALRLYQSLGFQQYGLEKHSLKQNGRYYDEIHMALDLTS